MSDNEESKKEEKEKFAEVTKSKEVQQEIEKLKKLQKGMGEPEKSSNQQSILPDKIDKDKDKENQQ